MRTGWEPDYELHKDPMVNAVLNLAGEMNALAGATADLLYALKYSKESGLSVAEAIEVAARTIADLTHLDVNVTNNEY